MPHSSIEWFSSEIGRTQMLEPDRVKKAMIFETITTYAPFLFVVLFSFNFKIEAGNSKYLFIPSIKSIVDHGALSETGALVLQFLVVIYLCMNVYFNIIFNNEIRSEVVKARIQRKKRADPENLIDYWWFMFLAGIFSVLSGFFLKFSNGVVAIGLFRAYIILGLFGGIYALTSIIPINCVRRQK